MPVAKSGGGGKRQRSPLARYAKNAARDASRSRRDPYGEGAKVINHARRTAKLANKLAPSVGRITKAERTVIRRMAANTLMTTTKGEARGVKARARKKARRS